MTLKRVTTREVARSRGPTSRLAPVRLRPRLLPAVLRGMSEGKTRYVEYWVRGRLFEYDYRMGKDRKSKQNLNELGLGWRAQGRLMGVIKWVPGFSFLFSLPGMVFLSLPRWWRVTVLSLFGHCYPGLTQSLLKGSVFVSESIHVTR